MERANNKRKNKGNKKAKKPPKVPIKTYRWEDIRRAKRRGGYPWTHLYKKPFREIVDPEQFTMEALRRTKSASTMGAKSEGVDISEVSSFVESGKTTPSFLTIEMVTEPPDDASQKNSRAGSLTIEEYIEDQEKEDDKDLDVQIKEFQTESVESLDNLSQYLDKEDTGPSNSNEETKHEEPSEANREKRAKSEETGQRKRKLSVDSSYSRYSLSKLGVMKKLRDAKNKIKVPKISFPTKKATKKRRSPPKETKKEEKPKKEEKSKKEPKEATKPRKEVKPIYIHIPLKPPPGETDEFSHLEFEPKKLEDTKPQEPQHPLKEEPKTEKIDEAKQENNENVESLTKVVKKPPKPLKINPAFKQLLKDVRQLKDKEEEAKKEIEPEKTEAPVDTKTPQEKETPIKPELENNEELDLTEQESPDDVFEQLFEASTSKKEEPPPSQPQTVVETASTSRNIRSKSAEPQRKRRSSIESSYSRKSLSKLGIIKKLKEATDKVKSAFSMETLRRKVSKKEVGAKKSKIETETEKPKAEPQKEQKVKKPKHTGLDKPKKVEPVYIHIPLKPPPGQTDEFSHLEYDATTSVQPEPKREERTDSLDSTSPENDDIHFIFLTPPSDDEILDDKVSEIPETPSSDDIVFFGSLKKLAQKVVDEVSPETKRKALETVREESTSSTDLESLGKKAEEVEAGGNRSNGGNGSREDVQQNQEENKPGEKMIVDVEDGLNEAPKTEELKSVLKSGEPSSPVLKKKVSFKRKKVTKPKTEDDSGYEAVEPPKDEAPQLDMKETTKEEIKEAEKKKPLLVGDVGQSMSVDEEKTYLDQKIVKDTSLEEDYNKWSKTGDHEYEPINPPDEVIVMTSSGIPSVTVVDADSEPKVVISATEILDKPVLDYTKKPFFNFGRFHREKASPSGESQESTTDHAQETEEPAELEAKSNAGPSKFQIAFKQKTDQLKNKTNELRNKVKNIKKPNIQMPKAPEFKKPNFKKPDFKKFKIEKPKLNINLPKIPDTTTIHLPHISLPGTKKTTETRTVETRQYSTESNAGDSTTPKRSKFDFAFSGTFPRFKKKKKQPAEETVIFATAPRNKKNKEESRKNESASSSIRIPLHSEDSMDADEKLDYRRDYVPTRTGYEDRETSEDIEPPSHTRFDKDIAIEDEYERETQEINKANYLNRWKHGNFSQQEKENEDEKIIEQLVEERFKQVGLGYSQGSYERNEDTQSETLEDRLRRDEDRPHYIEEEDFERRQNRADIITDLDNLEDDGEEIHIRDGYSSEGSVSLQRKGRLGKLDVDSDEFFVVHEIREGFQTPANALAQMNEYDPIGSNRSLPQEMQPKRKPIKKPKRKKTPHVSREEIHADEESVDGFIPPSRPKRRSKRNKKKHEDHGVVPYQETIRLEEEEILEPHGRRLDLPRESLGILGDDEGDDQEINEPEVLVHPYQDQVQEQTNLPSVPPRKHRSLKSLTQSENESILAEEQLVSDNRPPINIEDYIIPAHEMQAPPKRPGRKSRSNTSSLSRMSLPPSQRDTDSILTDEAFLMDNQPIPSYLIENQQYRQQVRGEQEAPQYLDEDQPLRPCAEEPCFQDIRDYMGYAIVDKSKPREPPLPPPRTPPRRRKRQAETEHQKFATVPRNVGPESSAPIRPLRNYSTLGHVKNVKTLYENDNNKENEPVNIAQYIEIEEEPNRDLVSGDVVQKMRQRPLPAPPRPPRKTKTSRKSLQDITLQENIIPSTPSDLKSSFVKEETVSTQTEPLPDDFVCEEIRQEPTDTVLTPTSQRKNETESGPRLITPTVYSYEETVTHGALVVEPLNGAKLIPDHQLSKERLVPITSDEETSEVPDSFKQLKSPEVVKGDKLQVSDLDVDNLRVNQLVASKIVVSEIESSTISTNEIQGKSGPLKLGDIELPPELLREIVSKIEGQPSKAEEKKTPTEEALEETGDQAVGHELSPEPPQPPPRSFTLEETTDDPPQPHRLQSEMLEPEVDDEPPPRPPGPIGDLYLPSQPPASFYALRAKQYVEENIPVAPKRKRQQKSRSRPVSRSRSTSDDSSLSPSHPRTRSPRPYRRYSEPSIPELTGRLVQACGTRINNSLKRLIYHLTENLLRNADGKQDLHVFMIILLVLIAGLILLGYGEDRTVVHLHHWEYFNPPKDL